MIKGRFSIKDLENLSGIQAHTIRIWEKRYQLLTPSRTQSNIRYYDAVNLSKLLNIAFLYKLGLKISKLAAMGDIQIQQEVGFYAQQVISDDIILMDFTKAMANFDAPLFEQTYHRLTTKSSLEEAFVKVLFPLMKNIGVQWQSSAITPAHEHFMSALLMRKLWVNIEGLEKHSSDVKKETYVLFLPENELHELSLVFYYYQLLIKGHQVVYLGANVPLDNLQSFTGRGNKTIFVSNFTVSPLKNDLPNYFAQFYKYLLQHTQNQFWVLGNQIATYNQPSLAKQIAICHKGLPIE